nr:hypothetical protein [Corynebacterium jeikeium]
MPAGTYKVETTGVPGAEKMKKDGTWERTKEPVNEVVASAPSLPRAPRTLRGRCQSRTRLRFARTRTETW